MYLRAALADKTTKKELIDKSTSLIDNVIEEIRLLSRNQITPQGKHGLNELIQPLVDNLNENTAIKTRFDYHVTDQSIPADLKLNIYRIIQEQINNILKHAGASHVDILLNSDDKFINVYIADDGKGFESSKKRDGIGITKMINRVESYNGEFSVESSPGGGVN